MKFMKGHTIAHNVKDSLSLKIEVIQLKARYGKLKFILNENCLKALQVCIMWKAFYFSNGSHTFALNEGKSGHKYA